jgi:hypothetical protein
VHVALRHPELLMTSELLDRSGGAPRIARCEQNVWRLFRIRNRRHYAESRTMPSSSVPPVISGL